MNNQKTIFLTGGGTLGSVTPMLALAEDLHDNYQCHFIGTEKGIEKEVAQNQGLIYHGIASGKLRRYWSIWNFIDPIFIIYGIFQSISLIIKYRPVAIISAGSFVSVSVAIAGRLLSIKIIILQLDKIPGLANRIMAKLASCIAVTLPESVKDYPKAELTGCPIRNQIRSSLDISPEQAKASFKLDPKIPTVLILGGGTGSTAINKLVLDNLYNLTQICQVIHITGKTKNISTEKNSRYFCTELLNTNQMSQAYAAANLVVSRAGMGVLTELSYLSKATILIPLPHSHQETNAKYFSDKHAVIQLNQHKTTAWNFVSTIKNLLTDSNQTKAMAQNLNHVLPANANHNLLSLITKTIAIKNSK